ncbi:Protein-glutamate methylesterase/protein-glutamine glutaminase [Paraburkholderia caffeinitolerans]|uniref:Protein-glutamate methylesterase/protein-glutamine glutaminase n=1 Tax=Paraburkholderia caffeinitolerans TaxID=1723730 RepID=A0A6J5FLC8_9BURK|nr:MULTISPECIES: chemotaxis response regulator protein-glutamate methylesterase [Paraburkholderia]CAB3780507.1 Protein-glutamate methylesterase/protein-glutamine glutaminase [Paraburkholderia caffeinitolerans]
MNAVQKIKVLCVDDSALIRSLMTEIINGQPDMTVVATAPDPLVARELIKQHNPDVLTLDVEMPRMDGLDFLEKLMRLRPMPVVMVSSLTERGNEITLRALELGAVDFVTKPKVGIRDGMLEYAEKLADKVRAASRARVRPAARAHAPAGAVAATSAMAASGAATPGAAAHAAHAAHPASVHSAHGAHAPVHAAPMLNNPLVSTEKLVIVGASTGGTEAIREVLQPLPPDAPAVLIAQHMPPGFTKSFAQRLNGLCRITVKEAEHGERVLPGHAYIAPGHAHLLLARSGANYIAHLSDEPPVNRHRPSVDVLFRSAALHAGKNAIGVILTGMGRDGAAGLLEMRQAGAFTLAQDEASCIVFGMPREAIAMGAADEIAPLAEMSRRVMLRLASMGERVQRV